MYYLLSVVLTFCLVLQARTEKQVVFSPSPTSQGVYVPDSLIQYLLENPLGTLKNPLATQLSGDEGNYELDYRIFHVNLDNTPEKEVIFDASYTSLDSLEGGFYPDNIILVLGKRGDKWKELGSEAFSYMTYMENDEVNLAPEIDTTYQLVVVKETAKGAGYNGVFYKICKIQKDTLLEVLEYPRYEYSNSASFQFDEIIREKEDFRAVSRLQSKMNYINNTSAQIQYNYTIYIEKEDAPQIIPLMTTVLKVDYYWDSSQYQFVPKPQKIGNYELKDNIDVLVDNLPVLFADTLKILAQKGTPEQQHYLQHFEFEKGKN
jgi:hypothetical protein